MSTVAEEPTFPAAARGEREREPPFRALGLTGAEFERIAALLGRRPNRWELAVFSLLWSEHCAYKHSALLLERFPSEGEAVLQGPGENAGVVDVGGEAVAFKVESHNHPSAVEPFQGAATGVGGILRDVVAMGARPIALLDGLRFGEPGWTFERAVAGIGHYGNCVGVPTVGGDTFFDDAYAANPLVNAMCVGILPAERLTRAAANGPGNAIVLYGATTGRDGIGGASILASQELSAEDDDKRPSVQIGDPFTGKKLIEASLALVESRLVESLQDLGAAGLASALAEMAGRGGAGVEVALDRVPLREDGMNPVEVVISESQERMVAVVSPENVGAVERVCRRWELAVAVIGEVTDTGELRATWDGKLVGSIPARLLTAEAPRYRVAPRARSLEPPIHHRPLPAERADLLDLLRSPNLRSRRAVYERYDHLVGSRTVRRPGLDAAVLRLRPSLRGLAVSLDAAGRIASLDPRTGGAGAVLEAARNVACAGGLPLAITNCLNFGNPERAEAGWELVEAIEGMAQACEALSIPVVSGNVSLYNETDGRSVYPTPAVGCVGVVDDVRTLPGRWREGDAILVAGQPALALDGSEYQARFLGGPAGRPPPPDLAAEAGLVRFLAAAAPVLTSAHDAAEGGLAIALAESALWAGIGADVDLDDDALAWFGEGGGQAVVTCRPRDVALLEGVPLRAVGVVGGGSLLGVTLAELRDAHEES
ncbi:MAG: phosphoribosylformylglycinamidine synthase subunit PurL [Thermoleophilia bacterium]|nr:phosphoribosylformylglycinamidine synthase subunit PurL [Thermoleophilia bacterium]